MRTVLDAMPAPVFVLDETATVLEMNTSATQLFGADKEQRLQMQTGEILHCIHVDGGRRECGKTDPCRGCIVRKSVNDAISGKQVVRKRSQMQVREKGRLRDIYLLVTTSPFDFDGRRLALLILEDMSELTQLKALIPICAGCKKIRNDNEYWDHLETYLKEHLDLNFSHGLCPDCIDKLYPQMKK